MLNNNKGFSTLAVVMVIMIAVLVVVMSAQRSISQGSQSQAQMRTHFDEKYLEQRELIGFLDSPERCLYTLNAFKSSMVNSTIYQAQQSTPSGHAAQASYATFVTALKFSVTKAEIQNIQAYSSDYKTATILLSYKINDQDAQIQIAATLDKSSLVADCLSDPRNYEPPGTLPAGI